MKTVGRGGKDIYWKNNQTIRKKKKTLKYVGMTTGPALYAAYALSLSGAENVFEESPKGGDIKEGMAWLIKRAFETKDKISTKNKISAPFDQLEVSYDLHTWSECSTDVLHRLRESQAHTRSVATKISSFRGRAGLLR